MSTFPKEDAYNQHDMEFIYTTQPQKQTHYITSTTIPERGRKMSFVDQNRKLVAQLAYMLSNLVALRHGRVVDVLMLDLSYLSISTYQPTSG